MTQDILVDAKVRRHELCRSWPEETAAQQAERQSGKLLAARDDTREIWWFPDWQLVDGQPIEEIAEILSLLRNAGCLGVGGWGAIQWLLSLHSLLDGCSPSEVLASCPGAVLSAAREEFFGR